MQADADAKGLVNIVHHIIIQTAYIAAKPAFINRSDLLQHSHGVLGQAKVWRDTDMGRLMEFLYSGRDGGNDDGWAVAISYIVLNHKYGAVAALFRANHRILISIVHLTAQHPIWQIPIHKDTSLFM